MPEHLALAGEADATGLLRPGGWIKLFRTPAAMDERVRDAEKWAREFGIEYAVLDPRGLAEKEPHLDRTADRRRYTAPSPSGQGSRMP